MTWLQATDGTWLQLGPATSALWVRSPAPPPDANTPPETLHALVMVQQTAQTWAVATGPREQMMALSDEIVRQAAEGAPALHADRLLVELGGAL